MTILTLKAFHYKLIIQLTIKANNIAIFFLCNSGYVFLLFFLYKAYYLLP